MKTSFGAAIVRQSLLGALAVLISLPFLWTLHRSFGLGNPPFTGILVLGLAVVASFAGAGALGVAVGQARGKAMVAALFGLLLGGSVAAIAAPLYVSMVAEALTHEAAGAVWSERDRLTGGATEELSSRAQKTLSAAREGRLREQLSEFQREAESATTPAARESALAKVRGLASQLLPTGREKVVGIFKSGVARSSAFALLFWAILGSPLAAAFEARRARRY